LTERFAHSCDQRLGIVAKMRVAHLDGLAAGKRLQRVG